MKLVPDHKLTDIEKDVTAIAINNFGSGGHPMALGVPKNGFSANIQHFPVDYAYECLEKAIDAGIARDTYRAAAYAALQKLQSVLDAPESEEPEVPAPVTKKPKCSRFYIEAVVNGEVLRSKSFGSVRAAEEGYGMLTDLVTVESAQLIGEHEGGTVKFHDL